MGPATMVGARPTTPRDLEAFADAGVTRLIVRPWERSPEAVDGLRRLADALF